MEGLEVKPLGELRISVIGCGSMGSALVRGFCRDGTISAQQITVADVDAERLSILEQEIGVQVTSDLDESTGDADLIILAVKPTVVEEVLVGLPNLRSGFPSPLLVSIAAGVRLEQLERFAGAPFRVVRAMPNLACEIGKGITCLFGADREEVAIAEILFGTTGATMVLPRESDLDLATGLSGSGPAFVALFIEALAAGGVKIGLPRDVAERLAAETALGATSLLLEKGITPTELIHKVSSPGGTTIAGLHVLEKESVRGSIMSAVEVAAKRSRELNSGKSDARDK
jgi:pyrroline-5-carboxylate reductase